MATLIIVYGNIVKQVFVTHCNLIAFNFGTKLAYDARLNQIMEND